MQKSNEQDIIKLTSILKYLNYIKDCFEKHNINNSNTLKNDFIAQAACTQFITNIYENKNKLQDETYDKLVELNKIKLAGARHIASHDYDSLEFRAIFAICKQLTITIIFEEINNVLSELSKIEEEQEADEQSEEESKEVIQNADND